MNRLEYIILSVLIIGVTFYSCKDDDDSPAEPEQNLVIDQELVGTWELTNILAPIATTPDLIGLALTAVFNGDGTAQFTTVESDSTTIDAATWGTLNDQLTLTFEGEAPRVSPYSINGNMATISSFPVEFQGSDILATLEFTKQ